MKAPRPLADLYALLRDLATSPREVLLLRNHHQWIGAGAIAVVSFPSVFGRDSHPGFVAVVLTLGALSWALDLAGTFAHAAWQLGRIWQDLTCPCCGGDDGDDDEPQDAPDGPQDDHGLTADDEAWLRAISALPHHTR